jgi:ribulose-bisphosphate carboxylase large chain
MSPERIVATYRLQVPPQDAAARARALAQEQSIEMPARAVRDRRVLDHVLAQVLDVQRQVDGASLATLALAAETVGADAGQLMNMLFGNSSLLPDVALVDLELPPGLTRAFGGPNAGIEGIRRLAGAFGRPLTCTALKPIGSSPAQMAELAATWAAAGIDVIKDDHGWADQAAAAFEVRVAACQRAVEAANAANGTRALYAPSLFGSARQMLRSVQYARGLGVRIVLVAPMVCGVSTLAELKREFPDVALLAHPALAGCSRIAPPVLLGTLFRLFGADAVIFPNHGGRFAYPPETCAAIARRCVAPLHGLRAALPVPAGGMRLERVPELKREYGADAMLLIGGALLEAQGRMAERSRAFVDAVAAPGEQVPA